MEEKYPLHEKVLQADTDGVSECIHQGASVDQLDELGNSPLHWAVLCGYYNIVELLLGAGANPNTMSADGYTPKWSACDFGLTEIEDLLSLYGGKVMTDNNFDKVSWSVFKGAIGESLQEEEGL